MNEETCARPREHYRGTMIRREQPRRRGTRLRVGLSQARSRAYGVCPERCPGRGSRRPTPARRIAQQRVAQPRRQIDRWLLSDGLDCFPYALGPLRLKPRESHSLRQAARNGSYVDEKPGERVTEGNPPPGQGIRSLSERLSSKSRRSSSRSRAPSRLLAEPPGAVEWRWRCCLGRRLCLGSRRHEWPGDRSPVSPGKPFERYGVGTADRPVVVRPSRTSKGNTLSVEHGCRCSVQRRGQSSSATP